MRLDQLDVVTRAFCQRRYRVDCASAATREPHSAVRATYPLLAARQAQRLTDTLKGFYNLQILASTRHKSAVRLSCASMRRMRSATSSATSHGRQVGSSRSTASR